MTTYLVTGALGCIGAWVVKTILDAGDRPAVFDAGGDARRLRALLSEDELARVLFLRGDVAERADVDAAFAASGAERVVHLAGLQVPFCKADPALGARVNVLGTIQVFAAARQRGIRHLAYASSAAVYGPPVAGVAAPDERAACEPATHYGVYKRANEGTARVFWADDGVSSVGLRPLTVYGVGRDQGLTSGPTRAMKAAVLGRRFTIPFSGATDFNYAADTAAAFVACADPARLRVERGAHVFNLHGDSVPVAEIVRAIDAQLPEDHKNLIDFAGPKLPIPPALDGTALAAVLPDLVLTPLEHGIAATMDRFRALQRAGRLDASELDA
jgi:nucleoside-diphosphate-sugar epimerase